MFALAVTVTVALPAATAAAVDPPAILYREGVSENEATGPWLPLDGARINSLGLVLGTRDPPKPPSDTSVLFRLTALAIPDGHPDQPAFDPAAPCTSSARPPGTEHALTVVQYEGPGSYSVRLDADVPSNGATASACSGGSSSVATFTIDPMVTMALRATRFELGGGPFQEVAAVTGIPTGGAGESQCARDASVQPDGSVRGADLTPLLGPTVIMRSITRAGRWTCVGRARDTFDGLHHTRWSAPVAFDVLAAFKTTLKAPDRRRPRYTITFDGMPAGSQGGSVTLRIATGKRCPRVAARTLRGTVDSKLRVRFTFRLPEKNKARGGRGVDGYGWLLRFSFKGTRFVLPGRLDLGAFLFPSRHQYGGQLLFGVGPENAQCTRII